MKQIHLLPLISPNFHEYMHTFRSPFLQDTGCVHALWSGRPCKQEGDRGSLGMGAPS